ncbi:MAG TPA: DUF1588 domain-containing protein [Polyangiaceae bacterium]|nr:DUF1588 domain-containing protein [Polyangiaceae bacterium]
MTIARCKAKAALSMAVLVSACGRAEGGSTDADPSVGGSTTSANGGHSGEAAASGGATSELQGGSSTTTGGSTASAGSGAGNAGECFPRSVPAVGDLAPPEVVRDRLSAFLLEGPSSAPLPQTTTPSWAAELATQFVTESPGPNPAYRRLFANWFAMPGMLTRVTLERKAAIEERASAWGTTWSLALASNWDFRALLTQGPDAAPGTAGMLTDPAFLSVYNTISWRGYWLTTSLLCINIPPEPAGPPSMQIFTREQLAEATPQPACSGCHRFFDPVGFAFDQFDALGNYTGAPVDTSGRLVTPSGTTFEFSDIDALGRQLGSSCEVALCVANTFMSQAWERTGVTPAQPNDEIPFVANQFAKSGFSGVELVRAIATTPSMLR